MRYPLDYDNIKYEISSKMLYQVIPPEKSSTPEIAFLVTMLKRRSGYGLAIVQR